ncbi:MAG TPA: GNAT family N-acetyltransferase [Candidatus Saccharimonadia bacterium]|nr:GNAT family N-acetyltransferase [Candidatus Saccharimonadia bacterium]
MPEPASRARTTIRRARPADVDALVAIGVGTYREHFADLWTPAGLEAFLARQFDAATLGAELEGDAVRYDFVFVGDELAGFSKVIRDQPVPLRDGERGLELQKIYFRRDATRRGFGAALIEHLLDVAAAAREPAIWLHVLKDNTGASRFYRRLGFADLGERELPVDRGTATMCVMRRALES